MNELVESEEELYAGDYELGKDTDDSASMQESDEER